MTQYLNEILAGKERMSEEEKRLPPHPPMSPFTNAPRKV